MGSEGPTGRERVPPVGHPRGLPWRSPCWLPQHLPASPPLGLGGTWSGVGGPSPQCAPPCPHLPVQEGEGTGGEGPSWLLHWLRSKSQRGSSAWAGRAGPTVLPGEPPCCCPAGGQVPLEARHRCLASTHHQTPHSDGWFHLIYTTRACVTGAGSCPCAPQAVTLPSTGTGSSTK